MKSYLYLEVKIDVALRGNVRHFYGVGELSNISILCFSLIFFKSAFFSLGASMFGRFGICIWCSRLKAIRHFAQGIWNRFLVAIVYFDLQGVPRKISVWSPVTRFLIVHLGSKIEPYVIDLAEIANEAAHIFVKRMFFPRRALPSECWGEEINHDFCPFYSI